MRNGMPSMWSGCWETESCDGWRVNGLPCHWALQSPCVCPCCHTREAEWQKLFLHLNLQKRDLSLFLSPILPLDMYKLTSELLGEGAYAKVQGAVSLQNGKEYAVKVSVSSGCQTWLRMQSVLAGPKPDTFHILQYGNSKAGLTGFNSLFLYLLAV